MPGNVHVFGVRHLSPGAAWNLLQFLDEVRPKAVLVEGPADCNGLVPEITHPDIVPPVAMMAYTQTLPVRTLLYPFAAYSPEWQALKWAQKNGALARFIDLPSHNFLGIEESRSNPEGENDEGIPDKYRLRQDIYNAFAESTGLPDYDTYWEQYFEHHLEGSTYREAAIAFGQGLRTIEQDEPDLDFAENLVREAYMRREIQKCLEEDGIPSDKVVVIVGAFHAPNVLNGDSPLEDSELAQIPTVETSHTLMPYSYFRLSRQSGYGAGNRAPAYFELFWECLHKDGNVDGLRTLYLSQVVRAHRESGIHRSTAEVIEAVRLAESLANLRGATAPTLQDLRDSAMTLLGHGDLATVAVPMALVEVGTRVGQLHGTARQTSIQIDFAQQLKRLNLEKYRKPVADTLKLDLRENRRVQSQQLAYQDLERSFFLHRLGVLGIGFGKPPEFSNSAPWFEEWVLQWDPGQEIELVEAVLLGDTIELAAGYKFKQILDETKTVGDAAGTVWEACLCGMPTILRQAQEQLQAIAANSSDFPAIASACASLGQTLKYGDIRKMELAPLEPLLASLYHQAVIQLPGASNVDAQGARAVAQGMGDIQATCNDFYQSLEEAPWQEALDEVAFRDDLNPYLSGFAAALLMERNALEEAKLANEVSRRLSPGMEADLGAGWFEGLATRNRYGLLSRLGVWEALALYIRDMSAEQFPRALVFLRRAFGTFSPSEKRHIANNLGELWGKNQDNVSEALETELNEEEEAAPQ